MTIYSGVKQVKENVCVKNIEDIEEGGIAKLLMYNYIQRKCDRLIVIQLVLLLVYLVAFYSKNAPKVLLIMLSFAVCIMCIIYFILSMHKYKRFKVSPLLKFVDKREEDLSNDSTLLFKNPETGDTIELMTNRFDETKAMYPYDYINGSVKSFKSGTILITPKWYAKDLDLDYVVVSCGFYLAVFTV